MKTKLIIRLKYGGLGDHLFFSHLPRIAKQHHYKYDKVLISNHSPYLSKETKRLVWELNPFVDGFTDEEGIYPKVSSVVIPTRNLLDEVMIASGLDDGERFHEPELYYKPNIIPELLDAVVFDPNFGTTIGHSSSQAVERYLKGHNIIVTHQMKLVNNHHPIKCDNILSSQSLKHFCDIIASCKTLYCFCTGTAHIAAAIGKPAIIFYNGKWKSRFKYSRVLQYVLLKDR